MQTKNLPNPFKPDEETAHNPPVNLMVVEMKGKKQNQCWYSDETAHCKLRTYPTPFKPRTDASPNMNSYRTHRNFDIKANTNNGGPRDIQSRTGNTPQQQNQTASSKYTAPNRFNEQVTPNPLCMSTRHTYIDLQHRKYGDDL
eukprot:scaffold6536_cov83-Skeletonema_dohrnii-CCMP3373.AAC.2